LLLPEFIQLYLYATYTKKEQIKIVPSSSVKSTYLFKQKKKSTITFSRFINLWTKEMGKTTLYNVKQITTLNNNINIDLFFNEFINNSSKIFVALPIAVASLAISLHIFIFITFTVFLSLI
jgi:hypothetical protein